MNEAHARNMRTTELVPFAEQELDNLQLVLAHPPVAVTELVKRVEQVAAKADQLDALLEDTSFANTQEVDVYLDKVRNVADEFGCDGLDELETELKQLKETMNEFDLADVNDLCEDIKRLRKLAQRIQENCIEAGIEVTF